MVERLLKISEHSGVLNQFRLHLGCDLLEEWELFDNQVEIIQEGLLNVLSNIVIESGLNVEWLV